MHVICESCYEQCAQESSHICPLDRQECQDEDVEWRECPAEELLRREVACWNREGGCQTATAASKISRHFQCECGHHSVSCTKCSTRVLCSDLGSHLISDCSSPAKCFESEDQVLLGYKDDKAYFTSFRQEFEEQAAEITSVLQRIVVDSAMHGDRLNEICQSMNTFKEILENELATRTPQNVDILCKSMRDLTAFNQEAKISWKTQTGKITSLFKKMAGFEEMLKDEVVKMKSETLDRFTQTAMAIRAELKKHNDRALDKIREVLRHTEILVAVSNFFVPGVKALQEKALKDGWAIYESELIYLRGYHLSPGIHLKKDGECLKVSALIRLWEGDMDEFLHWPFQHKIKLSVVHRKNGSKKECVTEPNPSDECYQIPSNSCNNAAYSPVHCLSLSALFTGGYVESDDLLFQLELLT